jgi:asparagine synthase (glutamine-hydrolysing)
MSGICGIINFDGSPVERDILTAMTQQAAYRGPDGINYWQNEHVGFAHLALITTPESVNERQPLVSGEVALIADARVDNRDDLIRALKASGHLKTDTPTDADLILAAYHKWDTDCAAHIIGDFSFALWDARHQRFFAARDPMGPRTLYYWRDGQRLAFATEVKQLLSLPYVPAVPYEPAIGIFLTGPFMPLDWSFYEGIKQLAPGQAVAATADDLRVWRFWEADPAHTLRYNNEDDYAEHFREMFKEAVACRLRSVKPVGLSLSGGVDSGSIAATIGWLLKHNKVVQVPFRAYCYAFEELTTSDERHISRGITDYYGLTQVDIPADDLWPLKDYPAHGPDRDDPYISPYNALFERRLTLAHADGIGLLLFGYRGDEIAGGYHVDYLGMLLGGRWRALRHELRHISLEQQIGLWPAARKFVIPSMQRAFWPRDGVRAMLTGKKPPQSRLYPPWVRPEFAERIQLGALLRDKHYVTPSLRYYSRNWRHRQIFTNPPVRVAMEAERSQAKYGMAYADPWADRRLAEFVLSVPQWIVHRYSEPKRIAQHAMRSIMPPNMPHRPAKIEPATLFTRGFNERGLGTIFDLIDNAIAHDQGYIDKHILRRTYDDYLRGVMPIHDFWWSFTLEMWLRQFWLS